MKRHLFAAVIATVCLGWQATVGSSRADAQACVTNLFSGLIQQNANCTGTIKPMHLVRLQKNNTYASYMDAAFVRQSSTTAVAQWNVLFSDRKNGSQPFNVNAPDSFRVTVNTNGTVTLTNLTWNTSSTFTATCSNDMIILSNSSAVYLISYGAPESDVC